MVMSLFLKEKNQMNKASHNRKKRMARRMMSPIMIKNHATLFNNSMWNERRDEIADRVRRNIIAVQLRKAERNRLKASRGLTFQGSAG